LLTIRLRFLISSVLQITFSTDLAAAFARHK
jgi:hypothetical protein